MQRIANGFRAAWQRTNYENNTDYRQLFLTSDVTQTRAIIFAIAAGIALFTIGDYIFFDTSLTFFGLLMLRLFLIGYCGYQFMVVKRVNGYRAYDITTFLYLLVMVTGVLLIDATRAQNYFPHIIILDLAVFIFYLVIPLRFLYQAISALIFSVGEVILICLTFREFMMPGLFTAFLSLIFSNLVAAICSLQMHAYRWRIYENIKERKETDRLVAIGQTAGMIGHDIRNPLQAITSEIYLARQAVAESPNTQGKAAALESIDMIEEQTDYISKIVLDLQDYARPLKPEYKEVELSRVVSRIFQTMKVPSNVTLKIDVQDASKIQTDPTLIRRALTNLVNNAIQAMPDGGILQIKAAKTGRRVIIEVADTGKGIPEEIKNRMFMPLVTTKAKGQGLGLVVVKRLIEALDGVVTFKSEAEKGTTFIIDLPIEQKK